MIPAAVISREDGEYLLSIAKIQGELLPVPEPDPGASGEDLGPEAFYPVRSQEALTEGSYMIFSEEYGQAFNPRAAQVNDSIAMTSNHASKRIFFMSMPPYIVFVSRRPCIFGTLPR